MTTKEPRAEREDTCDPLIDGLRSAAGEPSRAHDATVLAAAARACDELRGKPAAAPQHSAWRRPLALAASLAAAGLIVLFLGMPPGPEGEAPVLRSPRQASSIEPADGATLASPPRRLEWVAPATTGCVVELRDGEARILWRSAPVDDGHVDLPDPPLEALSVPGKYYWQVTCNGDASGASLGPFGFELHSPAH